MRRTWYPGGRDYPTAFADRCCLCRLLVFEDAQADCSNCSPITAYREQCGDPLGVFTEIEREPVMHQTCHDVGTRCLATKRLLAAAGRP